MVPDQLARFEGEHQVRFLSFVLLIGTLGASGCQTKNCAATCRHVYEPSECDLGPDGIKPETAIDQCVAECETALTKTGGLCVETPEGEECYNPYKQHPGTDEAPELANEFWAALWMDCVWEKAPNEGDKTGCEEIHPQTGGFCAPI